MKSPKNWWKNLSPTFKKAIIAIAVAVITLLGISVLIVTLKPILSVIGGVLILGLILFGEDIVALLQKQRIAKEAAIAQQESVQQSVWEEIGQTIVLPTITGVFGTNIQTESLIYLGPYNYGNGLYYQLPTICTSTERLNLQRKIERKLARYLQRTFKEIAQAGLVRIYSDILIITV